MTGQPAGEAQPTVIRTPDQRLRVFVSSTLKELGPEREAARQAISALRLTPIMFELGARPHPPRDLYRAYLEQSHLFIGIYWQQYGWVAPDMEISGLEDEYLLSGDLPKLIYFKAPAPEREDGLKALVNKIRNSGISYKYFSDAQELGELVGNDLALLLTERFEQAGLALSKPAGGYPEGEPQPATPPHLLSSLIGREQAIQSISAMLARPDVRLVTLLGPGGVGKTSLAVATSFSLQDRFKDGVIWVPLASVHSAELVLPAIARALGVRERGGHSLFESLAEYLSGSQCLLLLDNFEQVVSAGPLITELLSSAPGVKILVTSRAPLQIRGEWEVPVSPLPLPDSLESLKDSAAIQLFLERARAVSPDFALTDENRLSLQQIVRRLDGLPLAIELAAARIKLLPPVALLKRLNSSLKLLTTGVRDLPERQQTMRNTIGWSYSLLDPDTRKLFERLGVFVDGFTLEAAEAVCQLSDDLDILTGVETLLNNSLLRQEQGVTGEPRFRMLETIREYALEQLAERGELPSLQQKHAGYFHELVVSASSFLFTSQDEAWLDRLETDYSNLRAALAWLASRPEGVEKSWQILGPISLVWLGYRRGYLEEMRPWHERALEQTALLGADRRRGLVLVSAGLLAMWQSDLRTATQRMDLAVDILAEKGGPLEQALAYFSRGVLAVNQGQPDQGCVFLEKALDLEKELNLPWFEAMTHLHLGNVALSQGAVQAASQRMERALALGRQVQDDWIIASALNNQGEIARYQGDYDLAEMYYRESRDLFQSIRSYLDVARETHSLGYVALASEDLSGARSLFIESLELHQRLGVKRGVVESLVGLGAVLTAQGQMAQAAAIFSTAGAQFEALGTAIWPADRVELQRCLSDLQTQLGEEAYGAAQKAGQALTLEEALRRARQLTG